MSEQRRSLLPSLFIGIVAGIAIAALYFHTSFSTRSHDGESGIQALPVATALPEPSKTAFLEDERNTIDVFQSVSPSVVFITNKALVRRPFSFDVFEVRQGTGSGFVWDDRGHVVTNYHVVQNGSSWEITLSDNTTYEAERIGEDASKDLAVLRINAPRSKLKPVAIGSSEALIVGQKVIAIGNPFGLDQTLTTGVVSALDREIESVSQRTIHGVIQTDAAINPGNSGGPLLNSRGALIGVNTAIYSTSGSSAGIGFAVPVSIVRRVVPQLIKYGKIIQPGLGVFLLSEQRSERLGIDGAVIYRVQRGSSAARAGLRGIYEERGRLGDVIVGINGARVRNFDELSNQLENYRVGEVVTVNVLRNEDEMNVQIRLQEVN